MQSKSSASNGEEPSSYSLQTLTEQEQAEEASMGVLELKVLSHSFLFPFLLISFFLSLMRKKKGIIWYNLEFFLAFVNLMGFFFSQ